MKIAVVGSHVLNDEQRINAAFFLDAFFCRFSASNPILVSGGAEGIDTIAENLAEIYNWHHPPIIFKPENPQWEPRGYKARNLLIAKECDMLIAVISRLSKTHGSRWTAAKAEALGKPVRKFYV